MTYLWGSAILPRCRHTSWWEASSWLCASACPLRATPVSRRTLGELYLLGSPPFFLSRFLAWLRRHEERFWKWGLMLVPSALATRNESFRVQERLLDTLWLLFTSWAATCLWHVVASVIRLTLTGYAHLDVSKAEVGWQHATAQFHTVSRCFQSF